MKMMKTAARAEAAAETQPAMKALQRAPLAAPPAALQQAQTFGTLLGQSAARNAGNGAATAAVLALAGRVDTWSEFQALQAAAWQRFGQLQQGWMKGWGVWMQEVADLKRANTMSEHFEQQYNLAAQFSELLKDQLADVFNLQENVEVDYGYWIAQKLQAPTRKS